MRINMASSPLPLSFFPTSHAAPQHHHRHHSFRSSVPATTQLPSPDEQLHPDDSQFYPNNPPERKTIRYRLSQLCREGQPHLALQMFDTIPKPNTVLWNSIIIGFICNSMPHEAISIYSRMRYTSSFASDPYTYSSTLKACAETRQLQVGKAVHCHILRCDPYPSKIVYNSLLNMYSTCLTAVDSYNPDLVRRVFDVMPKRNVIAWNIMISWYVKTKKFLKAIGHFSMMMKTGTMPTIVSFLNVFPAISGIQDVKLANALLGILVKLGYEYANNMFVISSAILMYSELGHLYIARAVFDNSLERNTEIWNSMMNGYVQNNSPLEALNLFLEALESQDTLVLDDVTFLSVISAASLLLQLKFCQQLHAYLLKSSIHQVVLQNAIITMYSRCNCTIDSFKVFNGMVERDVVSWNSIICALVQNGFDDEALMLVYEMQKQGFSIDAVTVTALLSAASNLKDRETGRQTHCYLIRHNIHFEGMESYLIDMYAKSGMIKAAQTIFAVNSQLPKDQATWNSMIAGNIHNALIDDALYIFKEMLKQKVTPNAVTLASVLPACGQSGSITTGKQLHGFIFRNFLDENLFVNSALIDMYSKAGALSYAENVFKIAPEKNSVTFTNMILGYGQHGMGEKAVKLFNSLKEADIQPDAITFVAILSACSYSGLVDEGIQIFESMETEYHIKPSIEHYACVVDMLGRVGRVFEAYEFVKGMSEEGDAIGVWGSLLAACRNHKKLELAKVVAGKLLEIDGGENITGYQVLLSNIYAEEGNWKFVNSLRKDMNERGLRKEVGCSWINISGHAHSFVSKDKNHPHSSEIYKTLQTLIYHMKDFGYRPGSESSQRLISILAE